MYLPLAGYLHKSPDVLLSGIDHFDYIMIDNAELVSLWLIGKNHYVNCIKIVS